MTAADARTVVLIHGLWLTPRSWEPWIDRFRSRGHTVLAPSWPGLEGEVEALNRDPSPLRGLGIAKILDHYERIIRGLGTLPIIMGHSFGGLFTQLLINRGLGAAGVPISAGQTQGVLTLPPAMLRSGWPVLWNPFNYTRAEPLTPAQFNWRFTNELGAAESKEVYDRLHVPAAGRVFFVCVLALARPNSITAVDYRNPKRAPASAVVIMAPISRKPPIAVMMPSAISRNFFTTNCRRAVGPRHPQHLERTTCSPRRIPLLAAAPPRSGR